MHDNPMNLSLKRAGLRSGLYFSALVSKLQYQEGELILNACAYKQPVGRRRSECCTKKGGGLHRFLKASFK